MRHPDNPLVVSLFSLEEGTNHLRLEGTAEDVGISREEADLEGPVVLAADLYRTEMQVEVQGIVEVGILQSCDRCLDTVHGTIRASIRLLCEKRAERDTRSRDESRAEDLGLLYHDGRSLDLRGEVRELILVEVPWHPLCNPDCRGLCSRCGSNLNEGDCGCPPHRGAGPWEVLRGLPGGDPPESGGRAR